MTEEFDVGFLWDAEVEWDREDPFGGDRSKDFAKYTELGHDEGLKVYIAKYKWYNGGKLEKAFYWNGNEWEKVENIELDVVYDKFKFDRETRELKKEIFEDVGSVNNPELEEICKDKLQTYEHFPELIAETRTATLENASKMLEKYGMFVFKPRYGFAGHGVEIIEKLDDFEEPDEPEDFIIQRFIPTDGYPPWGVEGPHDLRTIVINGEIQNGNYVRVPDEGLISNISRGGNQKYISRDELPDEVVDIIKTIKEEFEEYQPAIFSVDIMFDEELNPWVVELNSKPGTYYHHEVKEKEKEIPKIKNILKMLKERAEASK
ncbi:MAG: RimK family alpha-L-glutamate ligase [Candidatus Nanohalobium sp.]